MIPKGSIKYEVTENTLLIHVHAKLLKLTTEYSHGSSDWNIVVMNLMNPTGTGEPDLSMRDSGGHGFGGGRRWLPDYHNQDGVAP